MGKKKQKFFQLTLKELRKKMEKTQKDIKEFNQASVSKIESRSDIKISTLIDYVKSLGLDVEIRAVKHDEDGNELKSFTLIKTDKHI